MSTDVQPVIQWKVLSTKLRAGKNTIQTAELEFWDPDAPRDGFYETPQGSPSYSKRFEKMFHGHRMVIDKWSWVPSTQTYYFWNPQGVCHQAALSDQYDGKHQQLPQTICQTLRKRVKKRVSARVMLASMTSKMTKTTPPPPKTTPLTTP